MMMMMFLGCVYYENGKSRKRGPKGEKENSQKSRKKIATSKGKAI